MENKGNTNRSASYTQFRLNSLTFCKVVKPNQLAVVNLYAKQLYLSTSSPLHTPRACGVRRSQAYPYESIRLGFDLRG
jgi:hypothetical protein